MPRGWQNTELYFQESFKGFHDASPRSPIVALPHFKKISSDLVMRTIQILFFSLVLFCFGQSVVLAESSSAFSSESTLDTSTLSDNATFAQRTDGSRLVDIYYDLFSNASGVALTVSYDGGTTFNSMSALTGDVGDSISAGARKHIVWNAGIDYSGSGSSNVKMRVVLSGVGGALSGAGVVDTAGPALTLPANVNASATSANGAVVTYSAASATDKVTSSRVISNSKESGTVFPIGTTLVWITATDAVANVSSGTLVVTVGCVGPSVRFAQRTDGSNLVDVYYDLFGSAVGLGLNVSYDEGKTFIPVSSVSGDIGSVSSPGLNKHLVWNAGQDYPNAENVAVRAQVSATNAVGGAARSVSEAGLVYTKPRVPQTISFASLRDRPYQYTPIDLPSATSTSGLSPEISLVSGPATLSGSHLLFTGTGTVTVRATQAGNVQYSAAPPVQQRFNVLPIPQSLQFEPLQTKVFGSGSLVLTASSSANLPPAFSIVSGPATISGSTLSIVGAGEVRVRASQNGNTFYGAAPYVEQILSVTKAPATVTLGSLIATWDGTPKQPTATTQPSGLPVRFTFSGGANPPVELGSHPVVATIDDVNYQGTISGTLVIGAAPTDVTLSQTWFRDAVPSETPIGQLSATDLDAGDQALLTYTLTKGENDTDNARFKIIGNELRTNATDFDYAKQRTQLIRVRATDPVGRSVESSFKLHLVPSSIAAQFFWKYQNTRAPSFVDVIYKMTDMRENGINLPQVALEKFNDDAKEKSLAVFTILEDGADTNNTERARQVSKIDDAAAKVRTVLLIDLSNSMVENLEMVKGAAKIMVDQMFEQQELAVWVFGGDYQMIRDFTPKTPANQVALKKAIDSIDQSSVHDPASTNLFGSSLAMLSLPQWKETFNQDFIETGALVVLTDGSDTAGEFTLQDVKTRRDAEHKKVFTVGLGISSAQDTTDLNQLGKSGYWPAKTGEELPSIFTKIQQVLLDDLRSYYWVNYASPKRGSSAPRMLSIALKDNTNNISSPPPSTPILGATNVGPAYWLNVNFSSAGFSSIAANKVMINRSVKDCEGAKRISVSKDAPTVMRAVTFMPFYKEKLPIYQWSLSDSTLGTISPIGKDGALLQVNPSGIAGKTTITVTDITNGTTLEQPVEIQFGLATDLLYAPADLSLSKTWFYDNVPSGTSVGTLSATDKDPGDVVTYALVSGTGDTDNAHFAVVDKTLRTNFYPFSYTTQRVQKIRLQAKDLAGRTVEKAMTISVLPASPMAQLELKNRFADPVPNYVNAIFKLTDQAKNGINLPKGLLAENSGIFQLRENGSLLSPSEACLQVAKIEDVPTKVRTVLLLDNSYSVGARLADIKAAAKLLVDNMFEQQYVAVYTFSDTYHLVQDFASKSPPNQAALKKAIDSIALGTSTTNLYGSALAMLSLAEWKESFNLDGIETGALVIVTDGSDQANLATLPQVVGKRDADKKRVYTVGLGAEINATALTQLGNAGYRAAASSSALPGIFTEIQRSIWDDSSSYYWTNYSSPKRGDTTNTLDIRLVGNANTAASGTISTTFSSKGFGNTASAVMINRTVNQTAGVSELFVPRDTPVDLSAFTMLPLPAQTAAYQWELGDKSLGALTLSKTDGSRVTLKPMGYYGVTTLELTDVANNLKKSIKLKFGALTDLINAPQDLALSSAWFYDDAQLGTLIGEFSATDLDSGDVLSYTLVPAPNGIDLSARDNAKFNIVNGNQLRTNRTDFNYATQRTQLIRVRVTDRAGMICERGFEISVVPGAPYAKLALKGSFTDAPSYVNAIFKLTDQSGNGINLPRSLFDQANSVFEIKEDGRLLSESEAVLQVAKIEDVPFKARTVLLLDNSVSVGANLGAIKNAAKTLVDAMFDQQEIAVYSFSGVCTQVKDFTAKTAANQLALKSAIDAIQIGSPTTNLYGCVLEMLTLPQWKESFTLAGIETGALVVLTDGRDEAGTANLAQVLSVRDVQNKRIYAIGIGSGVDTSALTKLGNGAARFVSQATEIGSVFGETQKRIQDDCGSYYWINYASPKRLNFNHALTVTLKNNTNLTATGTLTAYFNSGTFSDVTPGVAINRTVSKVLGIGSLAVRSGAPVVLQADTILPEKEAPSYTWKLGNPSLASLTPSGVDGGSLMITFLAPGNTTLSVTDVVNAHTKTIPLTIGAPAVLEPQTIVFTKPQDCYTTSGTLRMSAGASSGLPVRFSVSGPAKLGSDGRTVVLDGVVGVVKLTATQPGNSFYAPAASVNQQFNVSAPQVRKVDQIINFAGPSDCLTTSGSIALVATSTSGLPVSFSVDYGPARLGADGKTLILTQTPGTVIVTASQEGDSDFASAAPVSLQVSVKLPSVKANQTITAFSPVSAKILGVKPFPIVFPVATSGLPVSVAVKSGPATIVGDMVAVTGVGTVVLSANQGGNSSYNAAPEVTAQFLVSTSVSLAIVKQPVSVTVRPNAPASFSVGAKGTTLSYQWRKMGVAIGGANTATHAIASAGVGDTGAYDVVVSDPSGSVTSRSVTLTMEQYKWSTLAGTSPGSANGVGAAARFNEPQGVAVDPAGNVYVAEVSNHTVRKISPSGVTTTFAGLAGSAGSADGARAVARFNAPFSLTVDPSGVLYVCDAGNNTIRKVTPTGVVSTFAGAAGLSGSADGAGGKARFNGPGGIVMDVAGNLYVSDVFNCTIRKITSAGVVTTYAGSAGQSGSTDGIGASARFSAPLGLTVDKAGNVYVVDSKANVVRKIAPDRGVSTLAGSAGAAGGLADGSGGVARFNTPSGIVVDKAGLFYVADAGNAAIRKLTGTGMVSTLSGVAGAFGNIDGSLGAARFSYPFGIAANASGGLYVTDPVSHTVRQIAVAGGTVSTLAGMSSAGTVDGSGSAARFYGVQGIALGTDGILYVTDGNNHTVRKITSTGVVTTLAGRGRSAGAVDGAGGVARFKNPEGIVVVAGTVYVADKSNHVIRKITANGVVSTFAGSSGVKGTSNGIGSAARFNEPQGLVADSLGNLFVTDTKNHTIRKITPSGQVTTLAGLAGTPGNQSGTGSAARFEEPSGLAIEKGGSLIVGDTNNHVIRRVTMGGVVSIVAGVTGVSGYTDGIMGQARFNYPQAVTVDAQGRIFVTDSENHTVRRISTDGEVCTIGGVAGASGSGDGLDGAARFNYPQGIAVDGSGKLYVTDGDNNVIRVGTLMLTP